jgi:MoaA/NifB/PqqE/SkfB family radical SAM enzyme
MDLSILYRGPLSSCNYGCEYCPFAKREESYAQLETDRVALLRFVAWTSQQGAHRIGILFTPWGEALIRHWYQEALIELTRMKHVRRAAIQTNLSCSLNWLDRVERCDKDKLALWCTYHPGETTRDNFLAQCRELSRRGVRHSVGIVGLKQNMEEARWLRAQIPPDVYVWVNAYKRIEQYYSESELNELSALDPLFRFNAVNHASLNRNCRAGESVISVDGDGLIRRCHFIKTPIGNIYDRQWERCLALRPCSNATCGCHIGYVHLEHLKLYDVFGDGVLERIPAQVSTTG